MLALLEDYFLTKPKRLIQFGRALVVLGGWLIIFGLCGHVATSAVNEIGNISGHVGAVKVLADIYPSIPTWWVPESILGALPAIVVAVMGLWINQAGKHIQRTLG